ncbi:uncharacterized protein LOC133173404 [Saccostrea echinata]|uniref:uncharacterized protein LOC133173404 n=1 Tax=Saccostrea echinata TaxID=191078 RepID=UPI002A815E6D|nr:uncharacterized protein LOC133173404 [Saccostrea echinata]XP_061164372.1 uncharacterized protein LOC133173404 [Saccostrea echinata]
MYLYLRQGDVLELISGVVLKDGYRPVVGEVGNDLQLEPAIWFKSLIIDAILIDCDRRQVRWSRARIKPGERISEEIDDVSIMCEPDNVIRAKHFDTSVFEDYDYSELDPKAHEIFEATKQLLISIRKKELNDEQFKTELLRLLHCYIMPSVSLTTDDITNLKNALARVQSQLQNIDKIILKKDRAVQLTESSMAKQRETLLEREDFTSEKHILSCSPKFIQAFEKQIGKDVEETWQTMEVMQKKVNELKRDSCTSTELEQVRKERDKCYEKWEKLKVVKETIKEAILRRKKTNKRLSKFETLNVFHNVYIEINERLQAEKEEIHKLCLHKVQISSVREAIELALDELKTDGQTLGWQMKSDGTTENDINGMSCKPKDWYTLEETISAILADAKHDVTQKHVRFCAGIQDKIISALKEGQLFENQVNPLEEDLSVLSSSFVHIEDDLLASGDRCRDRRSRRGRSTMCIPEDDTQDVPRRRETVYQSLIDTVKREINEHIVNMVELLSQINPEHTRAGGSQSNASGKISICYQNHLCHKIIEPLESLYEKTYGSMCINVFNKVKDMSFEELGIDEPWIRHLNDLSSPVHITDVKVPIENISLTSVPSITSDLSLFSIGKMPIDELYRRAEKEGTKLENCMESGQYASPFPEDSELTHPKNMLDASPPNESDTIAFHEPPPSYEESSKLPPCYEQNSLASQIIQEDGQSLYDILQPGLDMIHTLVMENTVTGKLKLITKTYRFVGDQVSTLKSAASLQDFMGCCDELLTLLIVLLTYLNEEDFKRLYVQMYMVLDFKPQCMLGGVHDCSLTNFFAAFQYLQDRLVMQNVRQSNTESK